MPRRKLLALAARREGRPARILEFPELAPVLLRLETEYKALPAAQINGEVFAAGAVQVRDNSRPSSNVLKICCPTIPKTTSVP